jgi:hypothetical protein
MILLELPNLKALVLPSSVAENSCNAFSEYLAEKKHLGGLLILLPTKLSDKDGAGNNIDKGQVKSVLAELEKLLVHEEVPVSTNPFINTKCIYRSTDAVHLYIASLLP